MKRWPSLGAFVLRTFLWLPLCFAGWYLAAPVYGELVAGFARLFVAFLNGMLVRATELQHAQLVFVTTLQVAQPGGHPGVLAIEVNVLSYTYGLAFFVALMLASRAKWRHLLAGVAILLPFQGWGVAFDFLAHVGAKLGPDIAASAGLMDLREFIVLAYQAGNLVFPSLAPVALWVAFNRPYVESLLARRSRMQAPAAVSAR